MILTAQLFIALQKLYPKVVCMVDSQVFDSEGNKVEYDLQAVTAQAQKDECKATAKSKLAATDWAVLPDVGLKNQDAFVFYRLNLRNLVINPVTDPVWEDEPTPIWS